jgi:hypothetical protein
MDIRWGPPRGRFDSGQAAIESAITLPLFVFLILGIFQLGLMHQARLMTKYAAYKAARAGALHSASMKSMERAALAVLLPMISRDSGAGEYIKPTHASSDFQDKWRWPQVLSNRMAEAELPYVQVTLCGPLRGSFPGSAREVNFDAPAAVASDDWEQGQRTKLRLQVTFNYRMPIPFANWIIFHAARNREVPWLLRLGKARGAERSFRDASGADPYPALAEKGIYVQPIRATYPMRMQSNFLLQKPGHELPESNLCIFPFHYEAPPEGETAARTDAGARCALLPGARVDDDAELQSQPGAARQDQPPTAQRLARLFHGGDGGARAQLLCSDQPGDRGQLRGDEQPPRLHGRRQRHRGYDESGE